MKSSIDETPVKSISGGETLLSARAAAERLGIKRDTLYAYVSRGLLHSVAVSGSRERHYRAGDVERFRAGKGGERVREALIPLIDSAICQIDGGRFYYRGADAVRLAERATLEAAAALLWQVPDPDPFPAPAPQLQAGAARLGLIERCQIRLALAAGNDMAALDLSRAGVARTGRAIVAELVGAAGGDASAAGPVHAQLAAGWHLDPAGADLVRRVLVLLADHELNASTFVGRVVAATGATPYAVVAAALGALSGRRHGGASARSEALFREIGDGDPLAVMAGRLRRDDSLPGLGQPLYPDGDPRALAIIEAIGQARPAEGEHVAAAAIAAMRLTGEYPNVDFALGAVAVALDLPAGSALALFLVARSVGWIAHAIEQYDSGVLIRPRARYVGPPKARESEA